MFNHRDTEKIEEFHRRERGGREEEIRASHLALFDSTSPRSHPSLREFFCLLIGRTSSEYERVEPQRHRGHREEKSESGWTHKTKP